MNKLILVAALALGSASVAAVAATDGHSMSEHDMSGQSMSGHDMAGHNMKGEGAMSSHGALDWEHAKVSDTISISGCWIRALPAPAPSAGYFVVHNQGKGDIKLKGAASPTYGMVMLHKTTQKAGMSRMSEASDIAIAAGGTLEFKPGGYHAMLEQASQPPAVGSHVDMAFLFDNGEKASTQCEVKAANTRTR